jgi:hypothetical protein
VLACGALGQYDRERALTIAAAMGGELSVVHEDASSILALDRPPIQWRGSRQRGLAWSERVDPVPEPQLETWSDAATTGAACGLVIEGRRRYLHTSVAGGLKIYYLKDGRAVYFATLIDPLTSTASGSLSVDWDAWASILTLDYPVGERTPFTEIRSLPPYSRLTCRRGRARVSEERWPWAEIDPDLGVERGTAELLERLRAGIARLPAGPIVCQLSGGWDSRVCLGLVAEQRRGDTLALTVDHDGGTARELNIAADLAQIVRVPHEIAVGERSRYWSDMVTRTERVEFQLVRQPWRVPEIEPLLRSRAPVVDGLAFDALAMPGERFFTREAIAAGGDDAAARVYWKRLKEIQARRGPAALDPALARALWASSRRQLLAESQRFKGNPNRLPLTFHRTRLARGIALSVYNILGTDLPMVAPFTDDDAARAVLAIRPQQKYGGHVYQALFAALEPRFGHIPSTTVQDVPPGPRLARRSQSPAAADAYSECLRDGPLAPFVRPRITRVLGRHRRNQNLNPRVPVSVLGPAVFHLWRRRYRDQLGEVDARDLLA